MILPLDLLTAPVKLYHQGKYLREIPSPPNPPAADKDVEREGCYTLVSPAAFSVFLLKPVSALLTNNAMHDLFHLIRGYIDSLCYNLIFFSW